MLLRDAANGTSSTRNPPSTTVEFLCSFATAISGGDTGWLGSVGGSPVKARLTRMLRSAITAQQCPKAPFQAQHLHSSEKKKMHRTYRTEHHGSESAAVQIATIGVQGGIPVISVGCLSLRKQVWFWKKESV